MSTVTVFVGGIRPLPPDNEPTGIFKHECWEPVWLGREGLAGDQQADRRVHGGPHKALHLYPADHYPRLAAVFPDTDFHPGCLGENISTAGRTEAQIRIGDVFRLGGATVEVSQPRSPCWKIDRKLGSEGIMAHIAQTGLTGWYFRVLDEGAIQGGDELVLVERRSDLSLARLWKLLREHRPDPTELLAAAQAHGLSPSWVAKLEGRAAWLRDNA